MPIPFFFRKSAKMADVRFLTEEMRSFFDQYPYPILLVDKKDKIVLANPAVCALMACTKEQMMGTGLEQWGLSFSDIKKLAKQYSTDPHLYEVVTPQADAILVNMTVTALAQTQLLMITLDKQTQTPVGTSFLENCLQAYPMAVVLQDVQGKAILCNRYAEKMFAISSKRIHGQSLYSFLPKELVPSLRRVDDTIAQTESFETVSLSYMNPQGEEVQLEVTKAFVPAENGAEDIIATVFRNVTADRREIERLMQTKEMLQRILDHIPLGIYVRDELQRIIYLNKTASQLLTEFDTTTGNTGSSFNDLQQNKTVAAREKKVWLDGKACEFPEEEYTDNLGNKKILRLCKVPLKEDPSRQLVLSIVEDVTQERQQQKESKRINSILSAIVHNMPIGLYARTENGDLLLRNKQCETIFNVTSVTLFDKTGTLPHETPEQIRGYIERERKLLASGQTLDIAEEEYIAEDGEKKILHMVKVPVKEETKFVITLTEDITRRKMQEKEIIDAKNFLQTIINHLPVSLSVKDAKGKYILWNKKSEELFGAKAADVIGKMSYRDDLNQDQKDFLREKDLRVFESGKVQDIAQELISSAAEGAKIMHTVHTPVFHEDGTPDCLLTISEDITAKTRMEKQIREANDKNALLLDHAREAILIVENRKVIYSNSAFFKMLGYESVEKIKGHLLTDFVDKEFHVFLNDKYDNTLAGTAQPGRAISLRLLKKNGQLIEVEFDAVAARYLGRRVVLCFCRDITSDNRILRELREDKHTLKAVFEHSILPSFRLQENGYIKVMNKACRELFGFTPEDKNFYCNVYIRPAISLATRKLLKQGKMAEMDYVFDFDRAKAKFHDRIHGSGKLPLHITFVPINKRDTKEGVAADFVVFVQPQNQRLVSNITSSQSETAVDDTKKVPVEDGLLILPDSEPYVLCDANFNMQSCNALFCSLCQMKKEDLIGQNIRVLVDEKSLTQFEEDLKLLMQTGSLSHRDYQVGLPGADKNSVCLMGKREQDGRYLFVLRNMAFHQQILHVLEERSAQLNALLDATDGIVFTVFIQNGRLGGISHANQFLIKKLGFSAAALAGKRFQDLFEDTAKKQVVPAFKQFEKELQEKGKVSFAWNMLMASGQTFEAEVTVTVLDLPKQETALVVVRDLSEKQNEWARSSKTALELNSIRRALPGLYVKMNWAGTVLDICSNLSYWNNTQAQQVRNRNVNEFLPEELAGRVIAAVKESLAVNISTHFDLPLKLSGKPRHFEMTVSPITGQEEVVLWGTDVSAERENDRHLRHVYRLLDESHTSLDKQVDKILQFGVSAFHMEVGCVLRLEEKPYGTESCVMHVTQNDAQLKQGMTFEVGECLQTVQDGNVILWQDLEVCRSTKCIHHKQKWKSMVAAPLYVGSSVVGILCFASQEYHVPFSNGAEELAGILARWLGLRIELRKTGKMLDEASRSFARTLEYVEKPAVMLDLDYCMTFVNQPLLDLTGRHSGNMLGRNFFNEIVHDEKKSMKYFQQTCETTKKNIFEVHLDVYHKNGLYQDTQWEVFVCKDANGKVAGYGLIQESRS